MRPSICKLVYTRAIRPQQQLLWLYILALESFVIFLQLLALALQFELLEDSSTWLPLEVLIIANYTNIQMLN